MGAMENKGLNIFNSKYVLADGKTARTTTSRASWASWPTSISTTGPETGSPAGTGSNWSLKERVHGIPGQQFMEDMLSRGVERIAMRTFCAPTSSARMQGDGAPGAA